MGASPQFTATPKIGVGSLSVANTALDGTGTVATVFTAGTSGSRIDEVIIQAAGTTTTGMVRLFLYDGSNYSLFDEQTIAAVTPSSTVAAARYRKTYANLVLPTGWSLRAATAKAETFKVTALGGDF